MLHAGPQAASSPLQRVYRTKFALLTVVSTFLGITLITLAHWAAVDQSGAWLPGYPALGFAAGGRRDHRPTLMVHARARA